MELSHGSLFSGIGGFDLGFERAGFKSLWQVEINDYATKVLEKNFFDAQRFKDIRTAGRRNLPTPTVLTGGFPCQPFSVAGKQRGKADDRYLWPEMLRVINEVRPRFVVAENVHGIVKMALDQVLSDLEAINYTAGALIIPACAVDAPHQRKRVWIIAHDNNAGNGASTSRVDGIGKAQDKGWQEQPQFESGRHSEDVAESARQLFDRCGNPRKARRGEPPDSGIDATDTESGERSQSSTRNRRKVFARRSEEIISRNWWTVEPNVGRVAHGIPSRVDRLKCLGNAIVPQIAEFIAWRIREIIETSSE